MKKCAIYDTSLGKICLVYQDNLITEIRLTDSTQTGTPSDVTDYAIGQIREYLNGSRKVFDIPYKAEGTEFQQKVWKALSEIPYGETRSYKDIANTIGNPKACRAVGNANNHNPLMIIVPCHRVIGSTGKMIGYAGGIEMKEYLLNLEKKYL